METTTRGNDVPASPRFKATCYSCHYESLGALGTRCPECRFPLIAVPIAAEACEISDVLSRESISIGAPPLPGVDGTPRKAQLLAESRRRRRQTDTLRKVEESRKLRRAETDREIARIDRRRHAVVTFALASAAAIGALMAYVSVGI